MLYTHSLPRPLSLPQVLFTPKPAMDVTALVTAWKEIDASQEAAVVINGKHLYALYIRPCASTVTSKPHGGCISVSASVGVRPSASGASSSAPAIRTQHSSIPPPPTLFYNQT